MPRHFGVRFGLAAVLLLSGVGLSIERSQAQQTASAARPNMIIVLADDMGYADIHVDGNPVIQTPNLDQMARDGLQLTSLYSAPLCTPTRGMLLTSRYPVRTGLINVTGPGSPQGIRDQDQTIAQALKARGYRTAMFGKWHVGDFDTNPDWNPTKHGFDLFLGLPYSHDYNPPDGVPLYRNLEKVEQPVKYNLLTQRYTEEAIKFIRSAPNQPFFVYLAHNMPHIPIGTSDQFKGHSRAGRYGDVIEEIDWSVGQIMTTLRQLNIDRNTILVFQSDNGPWVSMAEQLYDRGDRGRKMQGEVGWPGILRGSKGSTYEGGVRVPGIVRWPGTIPAAKVSADMVSVMDWYPTFVGLAGGKIAADHPLDGIDIAAFLKGKGSDPRDEIFYYGGAQVQAVRQGSWKLRIGPAETAAPVAAAGARAARAGGTPPGAAAGGEAGAAGGPAGAPAANAQTDAGAGAARGRAGTAAAPGGASAELVTELFNVDVDPAERFDVSAEHPDIVARLRARIQEFGNAARATAARVFPFHELVSPWD
jgi:arylsulfatase A-like enzyme